MEKELIEQIQRSISRPFRVHVHKETYEDYIVIFGFATTKKVNGKSIRVIKFKGYFLDSNGDLKEEKEQVILQAQKFNPKPKKYIQVCRFENLKFSMG